MTLTEILTIINSIMILLLTIVGYYVRTVDRRLEKVESRQMAHHENASLHIDAPWKLRIEQRVDVIYDLLVKGTNK